jgi:predicted protein tyrosine phosphatase
LHLVGLEERDDDLGFLAIIAEPGNAGVAGIIQLTQADDQVGSAIFVRLESAANITAGDVDVDRLGTLMDVDGMSAVDDFLQRHVDNSPARLHCMGCGRTDCLATGVLSRYVGEGHDHVTEGVAVPEWM